MDRQTAVLVILGMATGLAGCATSSSVEDRQTPAVAESDPGAAQPDILDELRPCTPHHLGGKECDGTQQPQCVTFDREGVPWPQDTLAARQDWCARACDAESSCGDGYQCTASTTEGRPDRFCSPQLPFGPGGPGAPCGSFLDCGRDAPLCERGVCVEACDFSGDGAFGCYRKGGPCRHGSECQIHRPWCLFHDREGRFDPRAPGFQVYRSRCQPYCMTEADCGPGERCEGGFGWEGQQESYSVCIPQPRFGDLPFGAKCETDESCSREAPFCDGVCTKSCRDICPEGYSCKIRLIGDAQFARLCHEHEPSPDELDHGDSANFE